MKRIDCEWSEWIEEVEEVDGVEGVEEVERVDGVDGVEGVGRVDGIDGMIEVDGMVVEASNSSKCLECSMKMEQKKEEEGCLNTN